VFADAIAVVLGHAADTADTGLHVIAHAQPVDVVAGFAIAGEHARFNQPVQIRVAFGIDLGRVWIGAFRQVDLGL
jgi:hypothetical protein